MLRPRLPRPILAAPANPRPIVTFGAGSIVGDAHFPAYRKAGFPVAGLYDPDHAKAEKLADAWGVKAFGSIEEAAAVKDAIFDLATPPSRHADVLQALPDGAVALIQKPMGSDLAEATAILKICRDKKLKAAVNFQLRFAPMMLALKDAIAKGWLGEVVDFDAWLALATPWQLWEFLLKAPRVEIAMHSIHYLDLIRQLLGDPKGVHAKTLGHPAHTVAQTRTSAILDYGDRVRCALSINHDHKFGRKYQACEFRICGTEGAAYLKLGVNLDYPRGEPDVLEIHPKGGDGWVDVPLDGAWFPDAFVGRMANVQRFASGEDAELVSSVEDAWNTMALVEAAYQSSAAPATPLGEEALTWNRRSISRTTSSARCRTTTGRTITETDFVVHAGHTGDFFPHHMDAEFAKTTPFGQRIAHGTMVFSIGVGLTATLINPVAFSYGYDRLRFIKPVFIGDTITTRRPSPPRKTIPKRPDRRPRRRALRGDQPARRGGAGGRPHLDRRAAAKPVTQCALNSLLYPMRGNKGQDTP